MPREPLNLFYCDHHEFSLPPGHKFPLQKYRMLRHRLAGDRRFSLTPAPLALEQDLLRIHDPAYIKQFLEGTLELAAVRRIGLPWSEGLVQRTLASVGGTLAATRQAFESRMGSTEAGIGGTLAGGTHHAFRSQGAGFCVFNDLAVATEWARHYRGVSRVAIIDLDVHQGDGTAAIFQDDPQVFTLSLHGARNFPFRKQRSRLDIEFADGAGSAEYFAVLQPALEQVWAFSPELVFFQSGVDALGSDKLGRLALTHDDLAARDRIVLEAAVGRNIPIVITLGGGYSEPIELTVEAHAQTFQIAAETIRALGIEVA